MKGWVLHEMGNVEALLEIDWKTFLLTIFVVLLGTQAIVKACQWFFVDFLGIETKAMRQRKEEHELLIQTANGLKELSEQHAEDVKQSIKHDQKIQANLDACMKEIKKSVESTQEAIKQFAENRIHDREQSFAIQKELTENMGKIASGNESRDKQIENIIASEKESLADRINQKYKHYLSINGIPEDEVDEFVSLHAAYKGVGGNHHGDAKFNYCMEHLPIIPVEVKLKYD